MFLITPAPCVNKRVLLPLGGFVAAVIGFTALLYLFGAWFRPDVITVPPPPPAADLIAIENVIQPAWPPPELTVNVLVPVAPDALSASDAAL